MQSFAKAPYQQALPGYQYQFPRDHASHASYKTEWWYYTGHLQTPENRAFGYELTFFRVGTGLDPLPSIKTGKPVPSPWSVDNLYMAHFALTDDQGKRFYHTEQLTRSGLGWAGASTDSYNVWNKSWRTGQNAEKTGKLPSPESFHLRADYREEGIALDLTLSSAKPPVIHGRNGVSQKADCVGCASHYYSMTRLETKGTLSLKNQSWPVVGLTWMDHEFGSNQMTRDQVGWDWFSVQLEDDTELMLYQLRRKDGTPDPNSSGTYIPAKGSGHLVLSQFRIHPLGIWASTTTQGKYPSGWTIDVPDKKLSLTIQPTLRNQELSTRTSNGVSYWEGRCRVTGTHRGKPVKGQAYVELTGYAKAFRQKI